MYCKNCGNEILEDQKFCPKCGTEIIKKSVDKTKINPKKNTSKKTQAIIACVCCLVLIISATIGVILENNFSRDMDLDGITYFETKSENVVLDNENGIKYVNNEILMTVNDNVSENDVEELISKFGGKIVGKIDLTNDYQIQFDSTYNLSEINDIIDSFSDDIVKSASPNYAFSLNTDSINGDVYLPNDNEWDSWDEPPSGNNWGLEAIEAPDAWSYIELLQAVNVGVFDNMFYTGHKDLTFTERPLGNAKYDFGDNEKFSSHGTHVAGTIAADFDNKKGVSGVSVNQNLYGFSFETFQDKGTVYLFKVGLAYLIAVKDCRVVNISAGLDLEDFCADREVKNNLNTTPAKDAINLINNEITEFLKSLIASGKDFLICKSAGNQNSLDEHSGYKYFKKDVDDNNYPYEYISYSDFYNYCNEKDSEFEYPEYKDRKVEIEGRLEWGNVDTDNGLLCGIDDEEISSRIIVVGAIENKENGNYDICDFSQCGKRVDILAPGKDVFSTVKKENKSAYDNDSGTSMATPFVSGVAALIYSLRPDIDGKTVKSIICNTGTGEYGKQKQKYKLLNAKNALDKANKIDTKNDNLTDESTDINYGNVVIYNNCLYYWKYNSDSFSKEEVAFAQYYYNENAKNELICRDEEGNETVILITSGFSNIAIAKERIYYQEAKDHYNLIIKSCSLKGEDIKDYGDGTLCGVVNSGKYVVFKPNNKYTSGVYSIDTSNAYEKKIISNDYYLICSDDYVICSKSNESESIYDTEHKIYRINCDGSNEKEIYINKSATLKSIKSLKEDDFNVDGHIDISLPYVCGDNLYYIYEHKAGSGNCTQSERIMKININTGASTQLDGQIWWDSGFFTFDSVNDVYYQKYLENYYNTEVLNKNNYSDFSNLKLGEYGTDGSGALIPEFCETLGDKQYVLLTYGDFVSWNGWRQMYQFEKCALYEKDLSSGKVTKIYDVDNDSNIKNDFNGNQLEQNIPSDALEYSGHHYQIYSDVCDTWEKAKEYCEKLGGHLAVISSQEENDALFSYLISTGEENAYFGYSDNLEEGSWYWVCDESSYTNWHFDEPNNENSNEDYAMFYWKFNNGTWNDGNFGKGTESDDCNFICEWD